MKRVWPDELTCQEVVELVTRYDEGVLPADERRLFEEHLAICDACVTYCQQMRQVGAVACGLDHDHDQPLEPEIADLLLSVFRTEWQRRQGGG